MPCWEVNTMSVEFSVKSITYLKLALEELGHNFVVQGDKIMMGSGSSRITIDLVEANATLGSRYQSTLNEIKRKYSEVVIKGVAKKKRWIIKEQQDANKFKLKRF